MFVFDEHIPAATVNTTAAGLVAAIPFTPLVNLAVNSAVLKHAVVFLLKLGASLAAEVDVSNDFSAALLNTFAALSRTVSPIGPGGNGAIHGTCFDRAILGFG
jgi:hypothetical protein